MYPVLNIESVILHATNLFRFMEAALKNNFVVEHQHNEGIKDESDMNEGG